MINRYFIKHCAWVLLALLGTLWGQKVEASHVMGSDIQYTCYSNDSYYVKLVVYRDCSGINLGGSATISVRCLNGSTNFTKSISRTSVTDVTPVCVKKKSICSGGSFSPGIEEHVYEGWIYLGNQTCDEWELSWTECCRNGAITTGASGQNFYTTAYLKKGMTPCNNSPKFDNKPVAILCVGNDYIMNQGVTEADMDSLVYSLTNPRQASGSNTTWASGYSAQKPLKFFGWPSEKQAPPKGFYLDSATGDLYFRPIQEEITVMAIKVEEYRNINGVRTKVGEVVRDMQVIVKICTGNKNPVLQGPFSASVCAGQQICMTVKSTDPDRNDTTRVFWNKGIPNGVWTTDNGTKKNATGEMCWQTEEDDASDVPYTFVANVVDDACDINGFSSKAYRIKVNPIPKAEIVITELPCGEYKFESQPLETYINPTFVWRIDGTNYPYQNYTHKFSKPGKYPIRFTIDAVGCQKNYFDTVIVDTFVTISTINDTFVCRGQNITLPSTTNYGTAPYRYKWSTSANDTLTSITITPTATQYYKISVTDADGCVNSDSVLVKVQELPVIDLGPDKRICYGDSVTLSAGNDSIAMVYIWSGDAVAGNQRDLTVRDSGQYIVTVVDSFGCSMSDTFNLFVNPQLIPSPMTDIDICRGDTATVTAGLADTYEWYIMGNSTPFSTSRRIQVSPAANTTYWIRLGQTIGGVTCFGADTFDINVNQLPVINMAGQSVRACIYEGFTYLPNPNSFITSNGTSYYYSWSYPVPGVVDNGIFYIDSMQGAGTFWVTLSVTNNHGCTKVDSLPVIINPRPAVNAGPFRQLCNNAAPVDLNAHAGLSGLFSPIWSGTGVTFSGGKYFFDANTVSPGDYEIAVSVTNPSTGCKNVDSVIFRVIPIPVVVAGSLPRMCVNADRVLLNYATGASPAGGKWSIVGPGIEEVQFGNDSVHYYFNPELAGADQSGNRYLTYYYFKDGCDEIDSFPVIVDPLPTPDIQVNDTFVCINNGTLTLSDINNPFDPHVWSGTGVTGNGTTASFDPTVAGPGTHEVTLQVTNGWGCIAEDKINIVVQPLPTIIIDQPDAMCEGMDFNLTAHFAFAGGMQWTSSGDGVFSNPTDSITRYTPGPNDIVAKAFTISAYTTQNQECMADTARINAVINPIPVVDFSADPWAGCAPLLSNFTATSDAGTGATYEWDFGDPASGTLNTATGENATHTFVKAGRYNVTVKVTSIFGCYSSQSHEVTVYQVPTAQFVIKPPYTTVALPKVSFINRSEDAGNNPRFAWNFGDSPDSSFEKDPVHMYSSKDTGTYVVYLSVTTEEGCFDDTTGVVQIGPDITVFIPNAFTPDGVGDGPLMRNNRFFVTADGITEFEVTIFNRWGEQLYQSNDLNEGWDGTFRGEPCQMDVYVYSVTTRSFAGKEYKYYGTVTLLR